MGSATATVFSGFDPVLVSTFIVMILGLIFTPGPAVLKVVSDAMTNGVAGAHASMMGVFAANLMYALLAVAGVSALIFAFPILFDVIKWIGVAYLLHLAVKSFRTATSARESVAARAPRRSSRALFWSSLATQGANPKSVVSFCVILPLFAGEGPGIEGRMILLAMISIALEYPALLLYAVLGSTAARYAVTARSQRIMNAIGGCTLGLAAWMIARTSLSAR